MVHIDVYAIYETELVLYLVDLVDYWGTRPSFSIPVTDGMVGKLNGEEHTYSQSSTMKIYAPEATLER